MAVFTGSNDKDQYQSRQHGVILRDNWGRRWESTVDTDSGGTCAPINPKGWVDVLDTPAKFKRLAKDEDGRLSVEILIDDWIEYQEGRHERYLNDLWTDALAHFAQAGPKMFEERHPSLLKITGPPPQALEPLYALRDGNSWVLGKTTTPDPRLTKYFAKPKKVRPSFKDEAPDALEEVHDPEATGGKREPIKKGGKRLVEEAA